MKIMLERGDTVQMLPYKALLNVFKERNFYLDDVTREKIAEEIADKIGIVDNIDVRWTFDYFYFKPDGIDKTYSVPYESASFALIKR